MVLAEENLFKNIQELHRVKLKYFIEPMANETILGKINLIRFYQQLTQTIQ